MEAENTHPEINYIVQVQETKEVIQDLDLNGRIEDLKDQIFDLE